MITDTARSREPVSTVRTAVMGIPIKRLGVNSVAKAIIPRSTRILTNTSRANSMSREGLPMMTCGDTNFETDSVHDAFYKLQEMDLAGWGLGRVASIAHRSSTVDTSRLFPGYLSDPRKHRMTI